MSLLAGALRFALDRPPGEKLSDFQGEPLGRPARAGAVTDGSRVPQKQLLQDVWGPAHETETNYLRVFIAQVRRKLEPGPSQPRYFITEPGMGYRFEAE